MDGRIIITLLKHTACWNLHLSEWIFTQHLVLSFIWWATLLSLIADYVFLMPEYYKSSTHWTGVLPAFGGQITDTASQGQRQVASINWCFFFKLYLHSFSYSVKFSLWLTYFIKYFVTIYYFIMVATSIKLNFLQLCQLHMKFLHFRLACSLSLWQVHMHWKVTTSVNFPVMTSLTWSCLPQRTWIFCFPPTWALSWFSSWWFWPSSWFWWQLSVHRLLLCPLYRNGSFDLLSHFCCTALYWSL